MPKWLIFVIGAALSWGIYVPLVHTASTLLESKLRAFLFVGVAYLIVAVVVPSILMFGMRWDPTATPGGNPNFNTVPVMWGLVAGLAGALGALCVIFAAAYAGKGGVIYVAPLVFAGAPIVNTIATIYYFHPVKTAPDWRFFLGLALAAAGAAMVMLFKPVDTASHAAKTPAAATASADPGVIRH